MDANRSELDKRQAEFCNHLGLNLEHYQRLAKVYGTTDLVSCIELLRAKRHRAEFRKSMAAKLSHWLANPEWKSVPFSPNEIKWLAPKWPIQYRLPT